MLTIIQGMDGVIVDVLGGSVITIMSLVHVAIFVAVLLCLYLLQFCLFFCCFICFVFSL